MWKRSGAMAQWDGIFLANVRVSQYKGKFINENTN